MATILRVRGSEVERATATAGEEFDLRVGLAPIGLKLEGEFSVNRVRLDERRRNHWLHRGWGDQLGEEATSQTEK